MNKSIDMPYSILSKSDQNCAKQIVYDEKNSVSHKKKYFDACQ